MEAEDYTAAAACKSWAGEAVLALRLNSAFKAPIRSHCFLII